MKEVEGEGARQIAEDKAGKIFEGTCPKLSTKFKEILASAHRNFEEYNKVLESSIVVIIIIITIIITIINYCMINISAYYNHIINAE
jgi:ribosomal protein S30